MKKTVKQLLNEWGLNEASLSLDQGDVVFYKGQKWLVKYGSQSGVNKIILVGYEDNEGDYIEAPVSSVKIVTSATPETVKMADQGPTKPKGPSSSRGFRVGDKVKLKDDVVHGHGAVTYAGTKGRVTEIDKYGDIVTTFSYYDMGYSPRQLEKI